MLATIHFRALVEIAGIFNSNAYAVGYNCFFFQVLTKCGLIKRYGNNLRASRCPKRDETQVWLSLGHSKPSNPYHGWEMLGIFLVFGSVQSAHIASSSYVSLGNVMPVAQVYTCLTYMIRYLYTLSVLCLAGIVCSSSVWIEPKRYNWLGIWRLMHKGSRVCAPSGWLYYLARYYNACWW